MVATITLITVSANRLFLRSFVSWLSMVVAVTGAGGGFPWLMQSCILLYRMTRYKSYEPRVLSEVLIGKRQKWLLDFG